MDVRIFCGYCCSWVDKEEAKEEKLKSLKKKLKTFEGKRKGSCCCGYGYVVAIVAGKYTGKRAKKEKVEIFCRKKGFLLLWLVLCSSYSCWWVDKEEGKEEKS